MSFWVSETLIDIILTNNPSNITDTDVIPTGIGDHDMVGCVRKINNACYKSRLIICRDYKRYNSKAMQADLKKVNWIPFYNQVNVNEAWSFMKNVLHDIFESHAPKISKKVGGKPAPCMVK